MFAAFRHLFVAMRPFDVGTPFASAGIRAPRDLVAGQDELLPTVASAKVIDRGPPPPLFLRVPSAWVSLQHADHPFPAWLEARVHIYSLVREAKSPRTFPFTGLGGRFSMVSGTGIEPAWCEPMDPKSCVMTVFCRL